MAARSPLPVVRMGRSSQCTRSACAQGFAGLQGAAAHPASARNARSAANAPSWVVRRSNMPTGTVAAPTPRRSRSRNASGERMLATSSRRSPVAVGAHQGRAWYASASRRTGRTVGADEGRADPLADGNPPARRRGGGSAAPRSVRRTSPPGGRRQPRPRPVSGRRARRRRRWRSACRASADHAHPRQVKAARKRDEGSCGVGDPTGRA